VLGPHVYSQRSRIGHEFVANLAPRIVRIFTTFVRRLFAKPLTARFAQVISFFVNGLDVSPQSSLALVALIAKRAV
jgi:hypothetical protein